MMIVISLGNVLVVFWTGGWQRDRASRVRGQVLRGPCKLDEVAVLPDMLLNEHR